ncbi:hypothetical protein SALB1_3523 [Salinisphaera sp. LB1]|nr:hypothetical protein SALB1_3523 [Salinisphaera sp. LB1]
MSFLRRFLIGVGVVVAGAAMPAVAACLPDAAGYDFAAQRLDSALQQFAHTSGCPVRVDLGRYGRLKTSALKGRYTPADALVRLVRGTGLEVHVDNGKYAVNRADRHALKARIAATRSAISTARHGGIIGKARAAGFNQQLDSVWRNAQSLIRRQGFLSAAEKASFDRLIVYIRGQLVPAGS